jgi:acetyl-CoA carboxylase biotin carboxyl carrier protein
MADEKHVEKAAPLAAASTVNIETVRQLLVLMTEHEVAELEIEQGDTVVRLRKNAAVAAPMPAAVAPAAAAAAPASVREEKLPTINSPMVGTFYVAPSPDVAPLVKVGDHVSEDSVVCIIEAMKVFNEIRAETSGTIKNAQAVEFGQPLFAVRLD